MEALHRVETRNTPKVSFDAKTGRLELSGYRSMPESALDFYQPLIDWADKYAQTTQTLNTLFTIRLEYFNTASGKCILSVLKKIDQLAQKGHLVIVRWYYEEDDEDMLINAEDMNTSLDNIDIEKIPIKET